MLTTCAATGLASDSEGLLLAVLRGLSASEKPFIRGMTSPMTDEVRISRAAPDDHVMHSYHPSPCEPQVAAEQCEGGTLHLTRRAMVTWCVSSHQALWPLQAFRAPPTASQPQLRVVSGPPV